jgi:hypothetical protein
LRQFDVFLLVLPYLPGVALDFTQVVAYRESTITNDILNKSNSGASNFPATIQASRLYCLFLGPWRGLEISKLTHKANSSLLMYRRLYGPPRRIKSIAHMMIATELRPGSQASTWPRPDAVLERILPIRLVRNPTNTLITSPSPHPVMLMFPKPLPLVPCPV